MAIIAPIRGAAAKSVPELGQVIDRIQDHFVAQLNPVLTHLSAAPAWTYLQPQGTVGGVALQNGWVPLGINFNPPRFTKWNGVVYLSGLVKSGTIAANLTGTIFFLPVGYRPAMALEFVINSNGAFGAIDIGRFDFNATTNKAGSSVVITSGSNAAVSFDGITFLAEA